MIPSRGAVSWSEVVLNQFFAVPSQLSTQFRDYFFGRKEMMGRIEQRDVQQLKNQPDR